MRADGSRFWTMAVIDAVRDRDGKLIGFAKITRDMTERHLEQSRLLESERRFRHLVSPWWNDRQFSGLIGTA